MGRSSLKLVAFLYSKCIFCALLVAFCIGATAARCTKLQIWPQKPQRHSWTSKAKLRSLGNSCKYSTLRKLHRKLQLQLQLHKLSITTAQIVNYNCTFSIYNCTNQHQLHTKVSLAVAAVRVSPRTGTDKFALVVCVASDKLGRFFPAAIYRVWLASWLAGWSQL